MSRFIWLFVSLLLAGCSTASGPAFNESKTLPSGATGIYVYRVEHVVAGFGATISVDGKEIGVLKDNGFLFASLSPGPHTLSVPDRSNILKTNLIEYKFNLTPHQVRYIRLNWQADGKVQWSGAGAVPEWNWAFEAIAPKTAKTELSATHASQ